MAVVDVRDVSYRYGRVTALEHLSFSVPEGAVYALLGPNGSGKTTLLQILMGLRVPQHGQVSLMGVDSARLTLYQRAHIGYVAEGQVLPKWMRLDQLEAYLAPLYTTWDHALATELRERLELDPSRRIGTLSRGQTMKAALLCALAPRPKLVLMDEPFTGMDVVVRDDLVRGLLDSASNEGWTVVLCSHDIGEIELLADWVGFLDKGTMRVSEPMESLRARFRHVEVVTGETGMTSGQSVPSDWLSMERAARLVSFVVPEPDPEKLEKEVRERFPLASRIDVREATLRELFVALARGDRARGNNVEVAR